jgi:hypothetical protein
VAFCAFSWTAGPLGIESEVRCSVQLSYERARKQYAKLADAPGVSRRAEMSARNDLVHMAADV